MTLTLSYDHHEDIARAILTREGQVEECFFDRVKKPQQTGAIYHGVVDRVLPREKGAFIKLTDKVTGFLNDAEGLNAGDTLLVQIKSEGRGDKGPGLTRWISLPGLYVIYQPFDDDGIHFSRRLDDEARGRAEQHIHAALEAHPGGWVIRRAALKASHEAITQEVQELVKAAHKLEHLPQNQSLCFPAPTAFEQAILGHAGEGHMQVLMEKGTDLEKVTAYLKQARPSLLAGLKITETANAFDQFDLENFYAGLCQHEVALPKGGTIIFEQTETLHVIDVNSGERTHFLDINHDAAIAIMQQLRWRNIGGLIVIDFLKMKRNEDRHDVTDHLRELAAKDASPCDIYGFTRMGLCEISRARRGYSLAEMVKDIQG